MSDMSDDDREMVARTRERLEQIQTTLNQIRATQEAKQQERARAKSSPAAVLARYNRAHGQNPKITLKQICEEMGVSYSLIRQYKSRKRKRGTKE